MRFVGFTNNWISFTASFVTTGIYMFIYSGVYEMYWTLLAQMLQQNLIETQLLCRHCHGMVYNQTFACNIFPVELNVVCILLLSSILQVLILSIYPFSNSASDCGLAVGWVFARLCFYICLHFVKFLFYLFCCIIAKSTTINIRSSILLFNEHFWRVKTFKT